MLTKSIQHMDIKKFALVTTVMALNVYPFAALAELWRFQPNVTLEARYDDNLRLTTQPHEAVTATILRGVLGFSRLSETGGITGRLIADTRDYSGDEDVSNSNQNQNNILFKANANHRTELTKYGFDLSYKQDSTIRTVDAIFEDELESGLDNDTDVGFIELDIDRNTFKARPNIYHQLNERTGVSVYYDLIDVTYDNNISGSGVFDYDRHVFSVGIERRLSERDSMTLTASASRYNAPENNDNEIDTYELVAGYSRAFSESTSGKLELGVNEARQESLVSKSDERGFILFASLNHSTEQTRYLVELSHDLQPSGSGNVSETNQIDFKIKHQFSTRLNGFIDSRYQMRKTSHDSSSAKNHFASIEPGLRWKMTRWWNLGGGYKFRKGKRSVDVDTAESNIVYLSIGYSKPFTSD